MYKPYQSQSKNPNLSAWIPNEIESSINYFFSNFNKEISNIDNFLLDKLKFNNLDILYNSLSAEQIDAVATIIYQVENKKAVILADETGVGKGRTLASIYRYAKFNNKKVLFFTYNKDLFSDFIRDLEDIQINDYSKIWALHNNVNIYNTKEEIIFKASKTKNIRRINEKNIDDIDLMFCNYSQINTIKQKNKIEFLLKYCEKDTIIILDESHNACGNSNTRKNIEKLITKSLACVYASATFLKNEQEFELYQRALDSIDEQSLIFFKNTLEKENSLILRSYITKFLISKGTLIRREHQPMSTTWEHHSIDFNQYNPRFEEVREIFNKVFNIIEETKKYQTVYEDLKGVWFSAGAHINRIFKNLLLLSKLDELINLIENDVNNNKKPVIVLESTFSSIINQLLDNNFLDNETFNDTLEEDYESDISLSDSIYDKEYQNILKLKNYISLIIEKILLKSLPKFGLAENIYDKIKDLKNYINNIDDSWCILSPIDLIINKLKEKNISCVEISGRDFYLELEENKQILRKKTVIAKTKLINSFNEGINTCAIITRTGSTGFSMHSSEKFNDKRQRVLYELEISNRPTVRTQFIGRVRRKGQISEPEFKTIISNLPFEARLIETEQEKMRIMNSHISTDHTRLIGENIINLYSEEADFLAKQILTLNTKLAEKMGISLNSKDADFYYIDMLLKRSIILPNNIADKLYSYILNGLNISSKRSNVSFDYDYHIIEQKPFSSYMNEFEKQEFKEQWLNNKLFGFNNINYNFSSLVKLKYSLQNKIINETELQKIYNNSLDIVDDSKNFLKKTLIAMSNSFYYSSSSHLYKNFISQINNFKKGSYLSFNTYLGNVFGYIEEIIEPQEEYLKYYPTHYLVKIRSLNFDNIPKNSAYENILYLTLNDLIYCLNLKIRDNKNIDFNKFIQNDKKYDLETYTILGNPIFISYLNHLYQLGEIKEIKINNNKYYSIIIGKDIPEEVLLNLRKPIFNLKDIYKHILDKKSIYTSPSNKYEGLIKLEPSTGAVIMYSQNYNDKNIFDFALYKVIGSGTYSGQNIKKYIIDFKNLLRVCAMLNKRGVNFFIDK